jgi:hypothetical protein
VRHVIIKPGRDPLLAFLLASLGVAQAVGCGGHSQQHAELGADGGTAGVDQGATGGVGGVGGVGTGGSTGGAGGAPVVTYPEPPGVASCVDPQAWPLEGTGFERCSTGFFHRASVETCPPAPPLMGSTFGNCDELACETDTCILGTFCTSARCVQSCRVDADCASDELCFCDSGENHCVKAACKVDADCGDGLLCVLVPNPFTQAGEFACQRPDDECTAVCPSFTAGTGGSFYSGTCNDAPRDDGSSHRVCSYQPGTGGSCGRPFLIDGHETLAPARASADWLDLRAGAPCLDGLEPELRRALAEQWRNAALMEHASIAAFARFTLELLALGAPPSLVAAATEAMADERRHATLCFALASAYAGAPVGPGALDVRGCLATLDLESVVVTTFLEGCIGETIAAVEARAAARSVTDPVLERAFARIAADEARHAALAWRFVHWALERGGAPLIARLRAELALSLDASEAASASNVRHTAPSPAGLPVADEVALEHGLASPAFRASWRRTALTEIVGPCLEALAGFEPIAAESRQSVA